MSNIVPTGFRFVPTDDELVKYLICKIRNEPLPCEGIISETDVFGDRPPWELFGGSDHHHYDHGDVRYFFTTIKKKTKNSKKNMKRNVGDIGTWHGETKGIGIKDPKTRQVIGNRKAFNFKLKDMRSSTSKRRRSNSDDSRWLMMEYSLDGVSLKYKKPGPDYVLCRIKKKNLLQKQQEEEDEDCDSNMDDNAAADVVSGTPTTFIPPSGSNNVSYRPQSEYSTNPASTTGEYCDINNCSNGLLQSYPQGIQPDSSVAQAIGEEDYFFDDYIDVSLLIGSEQPSTGVEDMNIDVGNLEGELVLHPIGNEENINNYNLGSLPEYCDSTVQADGGGDSNDHKVDDNQLDDQAECVHRNNIDDQINSTSRYLDEEFVENLAQLNGNGDGVNNVGASSSDGFSFVDTFVYVDPLW
ncbi:hypothetical protein LguiA_032961 [Lonicera macranthoides]